MFWEPISSSACSSPAVVLPDGNALCRRELDTHVSEAVNTLQALPPRQFFFLHVGNTLSSLVGYLACLRARHVPLLLPVDLATELLQDLIALYQPDWVLGEALSGINLPGTKLHIHRPASQTGVSQLPLHPELGLLLSTSGTTGSAKLVRLSYAALQANAMSIARYLNLGPGDRALTVLPPHYSYGLSVINSHLLAGGSLVLRNVGVLSPEFSETLIQQHVTSISGVPYVYHMLHRTGFLDRSFPALRTLTQAGGRLDDGLCRVFGSAAADRGWQFFVMYGQTEATARISYLPPNDLLRKLGSIGNAIPGGQMRIDPITQELIYVGANVMMGYAESRADLALPDLLGGVLQTGDLARCDEEGYFYITGRLKRFVKLAGNRIGLDEVEQTLQVQLGLPVAVGGNDEHMHIWIESLNDEHCIDTARMLLRQRFGLHHSLFQLRCVAQLPLLPSGKKDYHALRDST